MDEIRIAFVCFGPKYFLYIRYFNAVRTCQYWVFLSITSKVVLLHCIQNVFLRIQKVMFAK